MRQSRGLTIVNPTAMLESKDPVNCLSGEDGARSKGNFQRPESNCGVAINSIFAKSSSNKHPKCLRQFGC